nr:immunoglobulin heavy chain junction region [Macaca mulatta]MOW77909.1 immunoglobulin heavy chain junction region [Macaca mulatta]MOW80575.1 immunoglobulin heavy chain junction region [Macaca mulatta]MOW86262.1 immunoglobulin heavy chain junction region [Macaca mulatta]
CAASPRLTSGTYYYPIVGNSLDVW